MQFRSSISKLKTLLCALAVICATQLKARPALEASLFRKINPPAAVQNIAGEKIRNIQWMQTEASVREELYRLKPSRISIPIRTKEGWFTLELAKAEVESPGFIIRTSGGKLYDTPLDKVLLYRGSIRGKKHSFAAFSISKQEMAAVFSSGEGNYNLVRHREAQGDVYAVFNDRDILEENPFMCHSDEIPANRNSHPLKEINTLSKGIQSGSCRRTDVYFECDHQLFLDQGATVAGAVNYVQSMFNVVAALYAMDGVNVRISEIYVHTQPDNYPNATSFDALDAFTDSVLIRPAFNGNLGHLLSTLPRANGGVAYLGVLCAQGSGVNIAYSNIYTSFLPLPYYSWTINVVAHELGHNFGSPHTQSCSWEISPGVLGMLDSCFTAEGDCYSGPRIASAGTIMSYCHLMNLGVDMTKGFGPKPGELIRNNYLLADCMPGAVEFPSLSISPADTICTGGTISLSVTAVEGASYQWSGPDGFLATTASISIPGAGAAQAGEYEVVISKDGCDALPLSTRVSVNCIFAIPQSNRIPCSRDRFEVEYLSTIAPNPGNQFRVEISDASGNFSNATQIGSLNSTARVGLIPVELPAAILPDSGYRIRILSTSPASTGEASLQTLRVLALPDGPSGTDQSRCGPGSLQLAASAQPGDSIFWYDSENTETRIGSGSVFQVNGLSSTRSYWAGSQRIRKDRVGPIPDFNSGDTLHVLNTYHGIFVEINKTVSLDSVLIFATGPGLLHINFKDTSNTILYKKIIRQVAGLPQGEKVFVGAELSAGNYRIDAENSTVPSLLRLNNFFSYPIVSEGMNITGSSVPGRYYFFYDWKISLPECPSSRTEIQAVILPVPSSPETTGSGRCGPGKVILRAQGAVTGQIYRWYTAETGGPAITGENSDSLVVENLTASAGYFASIVGEGACESERTPVFASVFAQPAAPVILLSGQLLISSADTLQQWYKDGNLLGVFGDTIDTEQFGNGQYQAMIITSDACTAASNIVTVVFTSGTGTTGNLFQIYPNPVKDYLQLVFPENGRYRLQCLDACGRRVWEGSADASMKVDFRFLPAGSYALMVESEKGMYGWYRMVKD